MDTVFVITKEALSVNSEPDWFGIIKDTATISLSVIAIYISWRTMKLSKVDKMLDTIKELISNTQIEKGNEHFVGNIAISKLCNYYTQNSVKNDKVKIPSRMKVENNNEFGLNYILISGVISSYFYHIIDSIIVLMNEINRWRILNSFTKDVLYCMPDHYDKMKVLNSIISPQFKLLIAIFYYYEEDKRLAQIIKEPSFGFIEAELFDNLFPDSEDSQKAKSMLINKINSISE